MKMPQRVKPRSSGAQIDRMRVRWPEMRHVDVSAKNMVAWIGPLRGFQMSYLVQVQWNWAVGRAFPHVLSLSLLFALGMASGSSTFPIFSSIANNLSSLRCAFSTPPQANGATPCGSRTPPCRGRRNGSTTTSSGMSTASGAAPTHLVRSPSGQASDPKRNWQPMPKSRTDARPVTKMIIWGRAGGRCQYRNCHERLDGIWRRETSAETRAISPISSPPRLAASAAIRSCHGSLRMIRAI